MIIRRGFQLALLFVMAGSIVSCSYFSAQATLERSRKKWDESRILDYRMKVKVDKTGHAGPEGAVIIEVRDGTMVSTNTVDREWLGGDPKKIESYDTIREMFDLIEKAETKGADVINVRYDSE